jgi:hypothetical protein
MSKLNFIIDGQRVDISEDVDFTRVYRGLETTDEKKNNYSLTVKFPFTPVNDLVFKRTNSLSYKSAFPYEPHLCDVSSDGVVLISKANLVLLSTTDSYECAMTWSNFDLIGSILNNDTKLGVFLESFPVLDWNLNHSLMTKTYDTGRANTYGHLPYNDGGGEVGIASTKFYSYPHPLINFNYLLSEIFSQLGLTLSIPTVKNDFYQSLIIRPNKEYDNYLNNVFEFNVDCFGLIQMYNANAAYFYPSAENTGTSPRTPAVGNNSYYFKTWIDSTDGEDDFFNNVSAIQQIYRFKSFANSVSTMTISNFTAGAGDRAIFKQWKASDQTWYTLYTISGNASYTLFAEEGDWFAFSTSIDDDTFKITITTTVEPSYKDTPNELRFPSLYHIPTCIDLTVGEFVKQALDLTCSELTYDVNSDTCTFANRTKENGSAYDITENITSIKEITYDTKYIYSKLAEFNKFKYLSTSPINSDYNITIVDDNLLPELTFIDLSFSTSNTQSGGTYDGFCQAIEHTFDSGQIWTRYTEQPLHLLYHNTTTSKIYFDASVLSMTNIFNDFWADFWSDLEALVLTGTARLLKLKTSITDIEFKRINTKGLVYIKTYGKYYGIIDIHKNGDFAEFFLLELF